MNLQGTKEHYYKKYDDLTRFISYFYQIESIKKLNPKTILEIGVGNKTVSNYLKQHGYKITTCDFDKELEPDCISDIRKLPFKTNSCDVISACEILEHLPWNDIDKTLRELHRVSKKNVIISVPYPSTGFEFIFKFPLVGRTFKKPFINLFFRIPLFKKNTVALEHYWEIGMQNYPIKRIRKAFRKRFIITAEGKPTLNFSHYFFILKKNLRVRSIEK